MAIAFDAVSLSSVSASVASFNWTHTPVGTPAGVYVVTITSGSSTEHATAVTYGGVAMTAEAGGSAVDTTAEPAVSTLWALDTSVPPTGAKTVEVTRTNNATEVCAFCITVTSGDGCDVTGVGLTQNDGILGETNVDDGSPGTNSTRFMVGFSGRASAPAVGSSTTTLGTIALGTSNRWGIGGRETTAGQGSRPVGFSDGTSDDRALVRWAVKQVAAPASSEDFPDMQDPARGVGALASARLGGMLQ